MVTVLTSYVGDIIRFLIITVSVSKKSKSNQFGCFLQIQPSYDMVILLPLYVGDIIRFLIITVSVSKKRVTFDVFFRFNPPMIW